MIILTEEIARLRERGELKKEPPKELLDDIQRWFGTVKSTRTQQTTSSVSSSAGLKPSPLSGTLSALLGLFVEIKGELKYAVDRKAEATEYQLKSINQLITLANRLLDAANILLADAKREWLVLGEDFDKPGIPSQQLEALFITYKHIFTDLNVHLIFNIPIALAYSDKARQLPQIERFCIYDTPVYTRKHTPDEQGRAALRKVLKARLLPELFEEGQQERLIVASGGNLNDLFSLTLNAAGYATLRPDANGKIGEPDVTQAINDKRVEYRNSLGTGPYDETVMPYEEKAARLVQIYRQKPGSEVPHPTLYSLLRANAVQEFNKERWFGVHPLVVDILKQHKKLRAIDAGGTI
jgi:hypothetical protein